MKILSPSRALEKNALKKVTEWKRWLILRRAVEPATTTRSLAPFSRGALRKSAVFFVSFRSLSRSLRDGMLEHPDASGTKKENKRLGTTNLHQARDATFFVSHRAQNRAQSGITQNHNPMITNKLHLSNAR